MKKITAQLVFIGLVLAIFVNIFDLWDDFQKLKLCDFFGSPETSEVKGPKNPNPPHIKTEDYLKIIIRSPLETEPIIFTPSKILHTRFNINGMTPDKTNSDRLIVIIFKNKKKLVHLAEEKAGIEADGNSELKFVGLHNILQKKFQKNKFKVFLQANLIKDGKIVKKSKFLSIPIILKREN